jgi:hypothetical protein
LQDSNYARPIKEARAQNDLACPIKEAKAPDVKIDFENTIIVHILKGSLVKGKSRIICIDFTGYINFTALRRKDRIKARKANGVELRDWPPRAFAESPYELRFKLKLIVIKLIVKRTEFSNIIVKMAKAILVVKVKEELE